VPPRVSSTRFHQRCREGNEVSGQANAGAAAACGPNEEAARIDQGP
jgi:hypothetical protein